MSLLDLIEWAGIKAVKQIMGENLTDERIEEIGKMWKIGLCQIIKHGKRTILKQKRTWL